MRDLSLNDAEASIDRQGVGHHAYALHQQNRPILTWSCNKVYTRLLYICEATLRYETVVKLQINRTQQLYAICFTKPPCSLSLLDGKICFVSPKSKET